MVTDKPVKNFLFSHHYCQYPSILLISELHAERLSLVDASTEGRENSLSLSNVSRAFFNILPSMVSMCHHRDSIYGTIRYIRGDVNATTSEFLLVGAGPIHYTARRAMGWPAPTSISHRKRNTEWPCEVWRLIPIPLLCYIYGFTTAKQVLSSQTLMFVPLAPSRLYLYNMSPCMFCFIVRNVPTCYTDTCRPTPTVGCGDQSLDGASGMNIIVC